jgi:hypothetical protein
MKYFALLFHALFGLCNVALAEPCLGKQIERCPTQVSSISFEAVAITAGPYGELWDVKYDGVNRIEVKISYMLSPQGNLSGTFLVSREQMEKVKRTALEKQFFALPTEITPQNIPMHDPDLRLTVTIDGKKHKVKLYSPGGLGSRPDAARFFAVWTEVFALLPLRPSWSN